MGEKCDDLIFRSTPSKSRKIRILQIFSYLTKCIGTYLKEKMMESEKIYLCFWDKMENNLKRIQAIWRADPKKIAEN